ncbi:MAG: hypothetical protein KA105_00810 [Caulobacter sp.]|nr:hypothetical protein [Caulobacter sp.]
MMAAASSTVIIACGAVAIDLGSIFVQSRQLQGIADLAALAAARDLDNAQQAAEATAAANGWDGPLTVTVTKGGYAASAQVAPASRFTPNAASPNAVRVKVSGKAHLFFGQVILGEDSTDIDRTATAARAELASFSLGSRLASLNGGVANALLTQLTGSSVSLSVMDYNALADADVDLLEYLDALKVDADLTAATYDEVLSSNVSTGQALTVLSTLLDDKGEDVAAAAVKKIAVAAGDATPAELDKLIDLGPYAAQDHVAGASGAGVALSALDLSNATLLVAGGGRQVQLDLGTSVPGLADVDAWLAIGERPNNSAWLTVASDGSSTIRTAQTRLYVETKLLTGGLLGALAQIKLPLYVEAASAEAKLQSMNCGANSAVLSVKPSLGDVWIGEIDKTKLNDFKTKITPTSAVLADVLNLITAKTSAHAQLGGQTWHSVSFSKADIAAGTVKTVSTTDTVTALTSSLVKDLGVEVKVLGLLKLLISDSAATKVIGGLLTAAAPSLDGVLNSLTSLLGVRLGEADVRVNGLRCREAALVA